MQTLAEPKSPRSMGNSIWDTTQKKASKKNWSYRPHPRNPKITIPTLKVTKPSKGVFLAFGEEYSSFEAVKQAAKAANFLRVKLGGLTFPV